MKKNLLSFIIFLIVPCIIESAPRLTSKYRYSVTAQSKKVSEKPERLYRVDSQQQISEDEKNYQIFSNVMAIFVNAVKCIMNPATVETPQNAYNAVNGFVNLMNIWTRSRLSQEKQEELALEIIKTCCNDHTHQHDVC